MMDDNNSEQDNETVIDQSISFEHDAGELEELEQHPIVNCYFECIFGLKEMYLLRGVILTYLSQYMEAIKDFNKLQQ